LGAQHSDTAETLTNLAALRRDQHDYEQAERLFTRALVIQEQTLTVTHLERASTLHGLARCYEAQGTLQAAALRYQQALTIREQVYGPDHSKTSETRESLQRVLHLLEKSQPQHS
jgi:tetratricopeptide (TPR) repeat protein